jgi:hypothetical protein
MPPWQPSRPARSSGIVIDREAILPDIGGGDLQGEDIAVIKIPRGALSQQRPQFRQDTRFGNTSVGRTVVAAAGLPICYG